MFTSCRSRELDKAAATVVLAERLQHAEASLATCVAQVDGVGKALWAVGRLLSAAAAGSGCLICNHRPPATLTILPGPKVPVVFQQRAKVSSGWDYKFLDHVVISTGGKSGELL